MAEVLGDIMAPIGKYIKDGEEKTRWLKCGVALQTDNGIRLKLEAVPVGREPDGLWLSVFERRNDQQQPQKPAPAPSQSAESKDDQSDIPF